jgi:hypothetical protein
MVSVGYEDDFGGHRTYEECCGQDEFHEMLCYEHFNYDIKSMQISIDFYESRAKQTKKKLARFKRLLKKK